MYFSSGFAQEDCSRSGPTSNPPSTRRAGALEIASARGTESSSFASCFAATLANIESGCAESISGREFIARTERSIKAISPRRNLGLPQATCGPWPQLLESSSRIGSTAWTFSARKSLCCASRQSYRSSNLANAVSNNRSILRQARQQSCKSLRGAVLSRSCVLASRTHSNE